MAPERTSSGFGGRLRDARERRGVSLRQIANSTKISVGVLEALERNDISKLPGGIFGRAFVRSYAIEVGLDPEATIQDFITNFPKDSVIAGHPTSDRIEDRVALEGDRQTAGTFLWMIAISVPIVAGLLYFATVGRQVPAESAQAPAAAGAVEKPAVQEPPPATVPRAACRAARGQRGAPFGLGLRRGRGVERRTNSGCGRCSARGGVRRSVDGGVDGEAALLGFRDRRRPAIDSASPAAGRTADGHGATRDGAHGRRRGRDRGAVQRRGCACAREGRPGRHRAIQPRQLQRVPADTLMGATPLLDLFKRGEVDRDVRLQAAQGAFAPRAHEQLAILVHLLEDPDRGIADRRRHHNKIPVEALEKFLARSDALICGSSSATGASFPRRFRRLSSTRIR
jgi:transcriptional regulator with XRE-family HTH domain